MLAPNGYAGADPAFAPSRNSIPRKSHWRLWAGVPDGHGSHSSYNALQTSVTENASRIGLSFQASYTFSKSIDDTSSASQYLPQNPQNPAADRGPSSFDVTHSFSLSLIQLLRWIASLS